MNKTNCFRWLLVAVLLLASSVSAQETINVLTTYAGNGTPADDGDGSAATSASLSTLFEIAFDTDGNAYIADNENHGPSEPVSPSPGRSHHGGS